MAKTSARERPGETAKHGPAARPPVTRPLGGRHAIVTGAGRGIGAAIADRLAALGAGITLVGRTAKTLETAQAALEAAHGVPTSIAVADVTDQAAIGQAFAAAAKALGVPAILVNNAGAAASAPFKRTDMKLWQHMIGVNLTSVYLCTHAVLPFMVEAGYGRIVSVASTAGLTGYRYVTAYCAAKHGVVGLTRALALETAKTGVTVNAVCPGYTEGDLIDDAIQNIVAKTGCTRDEAYAQLAAANPQGRLVRPDEVASAVAWLVMPEQAAITGQAIAVAGGEVL
jgi:NAD(P)-dependent dehydrogenase (short-subunit alcohol dehydrogenase family)